MEKLLFCESCGEYTYHTVKVTSDGYAEYTCPDCGLIIDEDVHPDDASY